MGKPVTICHLSQTETAATPPALAVAVEVAPEPQADLVAWVLAHWPDMPTLAPLAHLGIGTAWNAKAQRMEPRETVVIELRGEWKE